MATPTSFRVVAAKWADCPTCHSEGAVLMVGLDGRIRAECLGSLGSDYIYADGDPACHGSYKVNRDTNHWVVRDTGAPPDR